MTNEEKLKQALKDAKISAKNQKNHEITALKASGVSIFRISLPILFYGLIFCFISFFFDNLP